MKERVKVVHEKVGGGGGAVYGLGLIGAVFYYLQTATSLTEAIWGIIKAILWPAFLIYSILGSQGI